MTPVISLAPFIEHTLLRAEATPADVERLCSDAATNSLFGVCVSPLYVALAKRCLQGSPVRVVTVAGFPFGASAAETKAFEAERAVADGADEVDMVMAIGLALAGRWAEVEADIRTVRDAIPRAVLKVILETGCFDDAGIRRAATAAVTSGADFVKTSTGFGPRGATVADVVLLSEAVAGRARVKASGGIRTLEQATLLVEAGATRIGTSNGAEMVRASVTSAR
jgi:deoxyribose-phosphate aldolase